MTYGTPGRPGRAVRLDVMSQPVDSAVGAVRPYLARHRVAFLGDLTARLRTPPVSSASSWYGHTPGVRHSAGRLASARGETGSPVSRPHSARGGLQDPADGIRFRPALPARPAPRPLPRGWRTGRPKAPPLTGSTQHRTGRFRAPAASLRNALGAPVLRTGASALSNGRHATGGQARCGAGPVDRAGYEWHPL